jgi:hypothetical protein
LRAPDRRDCDSIREMSSEQVATAQPVASGRVARLLEEEGLLVVALSVFAIVLLVVLPQGLVGDGWLALVSGRWISQHGLPSHDTITIWGHGRAWVDQQWLAQLGIYTLWRLGGIKLAMLVHALLVMSALAGAALIARSHGATARSVTWVAIPALLAYYPVASVMRAQSFAFPLFVATLWLVLEDGRRPSARVFASLPLLVLWANVHGSVLLGAGLVSLAGVAAMVGRRRPTWRGLALLLAPWACVFASPYAVHLPAYYEKILVGSNFKHLITEWAPTTLGIVTAPAFVLVLGGVWLIGRSGRALPLLDQLAFVAFAVISLQAIRNIGWIALVALAVLPPLVERERMQTDEPRRLNRLLALTVLGSAVVALGVVAAKPTSWFTNAFPAEGAQGAESAAGRDGRVFATSSYGDWLLWTEPRLDGRVAFDTRLELLTPDQLEQLVRISGSAGDWLKSLRGYRVFVLNPQQDRTLEQGLKRALPVRVAFSSPQVVVLRRRG